ncbi:MAG: SDR family oxidoreductase, partial [bacterium]|nr:SDR family oxidoreductase [bacterium]
MAEIFLTGGTGFIGKRLLPKLTKGNKITLLVRKQSVAAAEEIIKKEKLKNIQLVIGDLEDKNLGLSGKEAKQIFRKIDYVFHLAADYDLSHSPEKIFRIILGGTKTVIKLLKEAPNLKAFIHVSTAYVVGVREGIIFEGQLIKPKAFRNSYEEAKFEAEVFLRKTKLPLVVIRPALVVGDSKTGEFDRVAKSGFYQMVRAIDKGLIVFYPGECEGFIP